MLRHDPGQHRDRERGEDHAHPEAVDEQGLSNRDIAAQLFLSPRTVGYHLYKAYPKLGVAARSELPDLLYDER
jgi:FixJ family two-component response regulator